MLEQYVINDDSDELDEQTDAEALIDEKIDVLDEIDNQFYVSIIKSIILLTLII